MAKKIVRGITDVKTINNQDYDTNNVNDLLSDGQYNYIHRKKGKNEEYHNLTDNIKTISSDNTELLAVTNNNKTTNTATLHPKHDAQKEQVLESTRNTVNIQHGTNGTAEKTSVDTNPQKVLEHENLKTGDGLVSLFNENTSTIKIEPKFKESGLNLDTLSNGIVRGSGFTSSVTQNPTGAEATFTTLQITDNSKVQFSIRQSLVEGAKAVIEYRFITGNKSTPWMTAPSSMNEINSLISQKQDVLTAGTGITIQGQTIDTNPQKVLEHENLLTVDGISKVTTGNTTTIGLKIIDNYSGDLNELTDTCIVKPTDNALNRPGGRGILTVVKVGDAVSQKYHSLSNKVYTRVGGYIKDQWVWIPWSDGGGGDVPPAS